MRKGAYTIPEGAAVSTSKIKDFSPNKPCYRRSRGSQFADKRSCGPSGYHVDVQTPQNLHPQLQTKKAEDLKPHHVA